MLSEGVSDFAETDLLACKLILEGQSERMSMLRAAHWGRSIPVPEADLPGQRSITVAGQVARRLCVIAQKIDIYMTCM